MDLAVAKAIDRAHMNTTSILTYNNENSLSCCLTIAYYSARKDYTIIRELPSGKGYALFSNLYKILKNLSYFHMNCEGRKR